jgi:hypothetical protein
MSTSSNYIQGSRILGFEGSRTCLLAEGSRVPAKRDSNENITFSLDFSLDPSNP